MNIFIKVTVLVLFVVVLGGIDYAGAVYIPNRPDLNVNTDAQGNRTVNLPGRTVDVNADGSSTIDYTGNRMIRTSADGTFQLQDGSRVIDIQAGQDLDTYERVIISQMPVIANVEVEGSEVHVEYSQPARFLGIFKSSLNATVIVENDGTVTVDLPWYSFFYRKSTKVLRRAVEAQINASVQSGAIDLELLGADASVTVNVQNSARVIGVVSTTVNTQVSGSGSTGGTTIASFVGSWSGRFSPSSIAAAAGCPGGSVSFNVQQDGKFQGPVYLDGYSATAFYGGGSVDNNGNMSGGWSVNTSGVIKNGTINLSGKLLASGSGSGSWSVPGGCLGSYSVTKR